MSPPRADLLVTGRIATLAGEDGPGWVSALAAIGGRVVATGSPEDLAALVGQGTRRLRLAPDEVAIPGLTDAHLHLAEAALARRRVDLDGARSIETIVERVRAAAAGERTRRPGSRGPAGTPTCSRRGPTPPTSSARRRAGSWLSGRTITTRSSPARARMAEAGIDDDRGDPDGGVIRRDATGHATGVLHENAAHAGRRAGSPGGRRARRRRAPTADRGAGRAGRGGRARPRRGLRSA